MYICISHRSYVSVRKRDEDKNENLSFPPFIFANEKGSRGKNISVELFSEKQIKKRRFGVGRVN